MKVKIALIGAAGYWGKNYIRIINDHPDAELVFLCDKNETDIRELSEKHPHISWATGVPLSNTIFDFDAAIVCTPVTTHHNIVRDLLLTGRHVLCEKAFTVTSKESEELIEIAKENKLTLSVGHTYRYNFGTRWIKNSIDKGELGDVYYVSMTRVGMSPVRQDVSALVDLGAHDISMLIHWFGMPKTVSSQGNSYLNDGIEDVVFSNLEFENGILANIKNSWINPVKRRYVTIVGSKKMIVFDDVNKTITEYMEQCGEIVESEVKFDVEEPLKEQVNDFIESIQQNREPKVTGADGLNVVIVLEAAQKSLKNNSEKIKL